MWGDLRKRLLAVVCCAVLLAGLPSAATSATTRVERHPYILGLDTAHACEVGVGGACIALRATDRYVTIDIQDDSGGRADAIYQFTDRYGALHQTGAICGSSRLRIPDEATDLDVFLQTLTAGALACAASDGPAFATTGEIVATFEIGAKRRFGKPFDTEQDCGAQVPASVGLAGVTDGGESVSLDIAVLLEGVTKAAAREVFAEVARSYAPLGIEVRVTSYRTVRFAGNDAPFLISQSKALFGGARPKRTDIVYLLTSKNITALNLDAVAGQADCIGGVRWPNRAFAVGEVAQEVDTGAGIVFYSDGTARIAAHEIGHLMGGQHEQANCVQGIVDLAPDDPTPCTLMSNFADFVSRDFGVVESAVVRGHAVDHAKP